jgi:hypothetical protein
MPISRPPALHVDHPAADGHDQPGLLRQRDELVGRHDAAPRMTPADQGLGADDGLAGKIEDGLVEQEELLVPEGRAQIDLELQAIPGIWIHARVEHRVAVLPRRLGCVEGQVGVAQELVGRRVLAHGHADAHRERHEFSSLPDLHRLSQGLDQPAG